MNSNMKIKFNGALIKGILLVQEKKAWEIAHAVNISDSYFSYIIRGRRQPSKQLVEKIAVALGVNPKVLIINNKPAPSGRPGSKQNLKTWGRKKRDLRSGRYKK